MRGERIEDFNTIDVDLFSFSSPVMGILGEGFDTIDFDLFNFSQLMIEDFGGVGKSLLIDIGISDAVNWSCWIDHLRYSYRVIN
jgi:hypothetical protein